MKNFSLATSASTIAIVASSGTAWAEAHDSALTGYTLTLEGGVGTIDNPWVDKFAEDEDGPSIQIFGDYEDKFGDASHTSFMGSVSLSRERAPMSDITGSLTFGMGLDTDADFQESEPGGSATFSSEVGQEFKFTALDAELGQTIPLAAANLRYHYGLRGLSTSTSLDKMGEFEGSGFSDTEVDTYESTFLGIGPRAGVGFSTTPASAPAMGNFGVSGNLGASVLFGKREDTFTSSFSFSGRGSGSSSSFSESESNSKTVFGLDAQVAIDYNLGPTSKLSVGYQLQQFWNVDVVSDEDTEDREPRLVQGVFVGFTTTF
jgi:hypothetical protein